MSLLPAFSSPTSSHFHLLVFPTCLASGLQRPPLVATPTALRLRARTRQRSPPPQPGSGASPWRDPGGSRPPGPPRPAPAAAYRRRRSAATPPQPCSTTFACSPRAARSCGRCPSWAASRATPSTRSSARACWRSVRRRAGACVLVTSQAGAAAPRSNAVHCRGSGCSQAAGTGAPAPARPGRCAGSRTRQYAGHSRCARPYFSAAQAAALC